MSDKTPPVDETPEEKERRLAREDMFDDVDDVDPATETVESLRADRSALQENAGRLTAALASAHTAQAQQAAACIPSADLADGVVYATRNIGGTYPDGQIQHSYSTPGHYLIQLITSWDGEFTVQGVKSRIPGQIKTVSALPITVVAAPTRFTPPSLHLR